MDKIEGKAIIGAAGEGQSLRRVIAEADSRQSVITKKELESVDVVNLPLEASAPAPGTINLPVKKSTSKYDQTHRMINGEMHYLTAAGEWKPMLYTNSKGGKPVNE